MDSQVVAIYNPITVVVGRRYKMMARSEGYKTVRVDNITKDQTGEVSILFSWSRGFAKPRGWEKQSATLFKSLLVEGGEDQVTI